MKIEDVRTFEALEKYLKEFRNFHDEPAPYDFNGAFHLFLAILDNLARNHLDVDVAQHEESVPGSRSSNFSSWKNWSGYTDAMLMAAAAISIAHESWKVIYSRRKRNANHYYRRGPGSSGRDHRKDDAR
jgi:hypothetical protein